MKTGRHAYQIPERASSLPLLLARGAALLAFAIYFSVMLYAGHVVDSDSLGLCLGICTIVFVTFLTVVARGYEESIRYRKTLRRHIEIMNHRQRIMKLRQGISK